MQAQIIDAATIIYVGCATQYVLQPPPPPRPQIHCHYRAREPACKVPSLWRTSEYGSSVWLILGRMGAGVKELLYMIAPRGVQD